MKTRTTLTIILTALCMNLYAQETKKDNSSGTEPMRVVGIGIKTMNLLNDLNLSNVMPGNRVVLTLNVIPNLRIQPELGLFSTKEFSELVDDDIETSNTTLGIGVYGMLPKEKTNLYGGLKYIRSSSSQEDVDYNSNPNPPYTPFYSVVTTETTSSSIGLVLGGEFYLSRHFSVGTEVGVQSISTEMKSSDSSEKTENSSFMTETNLLLRFYL